MSNPNENVALLKENFEQLQTDFDRFSTDFYENLFRIAPELRTLFREDLAGQGMKFITTLREILINAGEKVGETETLTELATFHATIGVPAKSFKPMKEALMDTMRQTLADKFTPEHEIAWRAAYDDLSSRMIRLGGIS